MGLCSLSTVRLESGVVEGKRKVFVLHWFPLEQYPPVMNLCNYFGDRSDYCVEVSTTRNDRGFQEYAHPRIRINRSRFPTARLHFFRKIIAYLIFPVLSVWRLFVFRPDILVYLEPHSCFPAFLFCFVFRRCPLFIHYHEYYEQREFSRRGMRLTRIFHWCERKFLHRHAIWISQTNMNRVTFFLQDCPEIASSKMRVLPNYPPVAWRSAQPISWPEYNEQPLKLLYIGALSGEDTYVESVLLWILSNPGLNVTFDVYCNNMAESAKQLFRRYCDARIRLHEQSVPYFDLSRVIPQFHVGLILYKANTKNYEYNASNKLFEYLICGLDAWYPAKMLGVKPYARVDAWPRVIEVDFENLGSVDLGKLRSRDGLRNKPWTETCESEHAILEAEMRKVIEAESSAVSIQ